MAHALITLLIIGIIICTVFIESQSSNSPVREEFRLKRCIEECKYLLKPSIFLIGDCIKRCKARFEEKT
ncbi:hypothetical protein AAHE18_02G151700 [Arachis hypogaea]|nr:uncharacterized protein DS421_2g56020 [Arachis hypogaea]QHO54355.1 uncharacterized protein DS421_2g56020 [Arachis hypogaea]